MILRLIGAALAVVILVGGTWLAAATYTARQSPTGAPAETAAIEKTVHEFLLRRPEVIVEAMQRLQARQIEERQWQMVAMLSTVKTELRQDPQSPVVGNPKGNVTLIEFFDYRCPYCRQASPMLKALLKSDPNIRMVYKELPVLGPDSIAASRLSLAVFLEAPDKYMALHDALFDFRGDVTPDIVLAHLEELDLDLAKIQARAASDEVGAMIQKNLVLAQKLGIQGTPAFVVGDTVIPGYVEGPQLQLAIQAARRACESC